jgi:hypothetical protein
MHHLARRVLTLRRLQPLLSAALVALAVGGPVEAQRALPTLDVGGASMRYADSLVARGRRSARHSRSSGRAPRSGGSGTFSQFGQGWSTQGSVNGSVYTPTLWRLVGELAGSAGGSAHRDGARTGQGLALARAYVMGSRGGAWGGAGGGRTWDGLVWRGLRQAEVGAWGELAPGSTTLATVTPTAVDDTIRYTDVQLAMRWSVARVDLGLSAGARTGERLRPTAAPPSDGGAAARRCGWRGGSPSRRARGPTRST